MVQHTSQARSVVALTLHAKRLARRRWRQLVWLRGDAHQCRTLALALWQARSWHAPLWVGEQVWLDAQKSIDGGCLPPSAILSPRKAHTRLGAEHQLVVLDASVTGLDPEALGALSGTLAAGGLMLLITPSDWGAKPDPDYARIADHPRHWSDLSAHYLTRLARQLHTSSQVVHWVAGQMPRLPLLPVAKTTETYSGDRDCLSADQANAVNELVSLKRRRPLVITADRGRGKSAALGIACARLLTASPLHKPRRIMITAPRLSAVESVFERVVMLCPDGRLGSAGHFVLAQGSELVFLPPDLLTEQVSAQQQGGDGSYLMVDEAAAIPAALLGQWLSAFPRIAFATTVHGYEGSGRGFALRFRDTLERLTPDWKALALKAPIRWHAGDPLEALINQLLLLKAPLPIAQQVGGEVATKLIERAWLGQQDAPLEKLFGLLVQSHYRTSPNDLRQLLDGPGTALRVIEQKNEPQAVLVTREEGGFDPVLADQVARGERRPQGHLLAQSLATHAGSRDALTARWRRVARIATHPERRRQGLGKFLLEDDIADAKRQGIALYGATFGAEASLLRFWLAQGFTPVRLGVTRETATGEYAVMVAKALNAEGQAVLKELNERFQAALIGLLAFELKALPADVLVLLLGQLPSVALSPREQQDIEDVATAHRDPALARPALQALAHQASHRTLTHECQQAQQLAAWAFQNVPIASGHKEAVKALRYAVATLRDQVNH